MIEVYQIRGLKKQETAIRNDSHFYTFTRCYNPLVILFGQQYLTNTIMRKLIKEHRLYIIAAGGMLIAYLIPRFILPWALSHPGADYELVQTIFGFGFSQLNNSPTSIIVTWLLLTTIAVLIYQRNRIRFFKIISKLQDKFYSHFILILLAATLATIVFFLLRNEYLNTDGIWFAEKFARDVPGKGAHVTHDEMWELYIHSRFWLYTNHYWGWTVNFSYQVLSSLAGGVFIFLLLYYCRRLLRDKALPLFLLIISGGIMQLFFGDVENYTLTSVIILAYFFAALLFLESKVSLMLPSGLLALGLTFHLLAGFLIPSLVYLGWISLHRRHRLDAIISVILFLLIVGCTLWFFDRHNLPISDLYYRSFAFGYGGEVETLIEPTWQELIARINLLALLFPANALILLLLVFRRIQATTINMHLGIASFFMMLLFFVWRSAIGIYDDWNLFANSALVLSILGWYNLLKSDVKYKGELLIIFFSLSTLHTYNWIIANHFV